MDGKLIWTNLGMREEKGSKEVVQKLDLFNDLKFLF